MHDNCVFFDSVCNSILIRVWFFVLPFSISNRCACALCISRYIFVIAKLLLTKRTINIYFLIFLWLFSLWTRETLQNYIICNLLSAAASVFLLLFYEFVIYLMLEPSFFCLMKDNFFNSLSRSDILPNDGIFLSCHFVKKSLIIELFMDLPFSPFRKFKRRWILKIGFVQLFYSSYFK